MLLIQSEKRSQAPPFFTRNPASIVEDARRLIELSRNVQDQITQNVHPDKATFANTLRPLVHAENSMQSESHILQFYQDVSSDPKLRDASGEADKLLKDFRTESAMREDLYRLVDAVLKRNENLEVESRHLLEQMHRAYTRNGLGLSAGPKRDRFKEIQSRLNQLRVDFRQFQNEESEGIWFLPAELDGVPEDDISGLEKGSGDNEGKLRQRILYPQLNPIMELAKNSETRKRCFIAWENSRSKAVVALRDTLVLRDEAARLLGYPNHATFSIEAKMAPSLESVNSFLADLRSRLTPGGLKEIENLKKVKRTDLESRGETYDGRFYFWDRSFYEQIMLKTQHSFDKAKLAEYFPLQTSILRMFKLFEQLFGLVFSEIPVEERRTLGEQDRETVWHEDVQVFRVWDEESQGSGFLGYLYLDLYDRENKYGGAANFNLQPVRMLSIYLSTSHYNFSAILYT
jgi:metallopeptidase MepB